MKYNGDLGLRSYSDTSGSLLQASTNLSNWALTSIGERTDVGDTTVGIGSLPANKTAADSYHLVKYSVNTTVTNQTNLRVKLTYWIVKPRNNLPRYVAGSSVLFDPLVVLTDGLTNAGITGTLNRPDTTPYESTNFVQLFKLSKPRVNWIEAGDKINVFVRIGGIRKIQYDEWAYIYAKKNFTKIILFKLEGAPVVDTDGDVGTAACQVSFNATLRASFFQPSPTARTVAVGGTYAALSGQEAVQPEQSGVVAPVNA